MAQRNFKKVIEDPKDDNDVLLKYKINNVMINHSSYQNKKYDR